MRIGFSKRWDCAPYPMGMLAVGTVVTAGCTVSGLGLVYLIGLPWYWSPYIFGGLATLFVAAAYQWRWASGDLSGTGALFTTIAFLALLRAPLLPSVIVMGVHLLLASFGQSSSDPGPYQKNTPIWYAFRDYITLGALRRLVDIEL